MLCSRTLSCVGCAGLWLYDFGLRLKITLPAITAVLLLLLLELPLSLEVFLQAFLNIFYDAVMLWITWKEQRF